MKQGETLLNVVKICMVLKLDYQTFAMLFRSLGEMKEKVMVLHRTVQHENVSVRSNESSFITSGGAFICQTVNFHANLPFVLWL